MPRIYDFKSNPHDYCKGCFPSEEKAEVMHNFGWKFGDESAFAYDETHPPYEDGDVCESCGKQLKDKDN